MANYRQSLNDAGADARPSPLCQFVMGLCFLLLHLQKSYLHAFSKTHPPNDCNLFSWSTYFCNLSVFQLVSKITLFSKEKLEIVPEKKNSQRACGRCLGLKPPLFQTTMKARIGHPWPDQTPWCLLCSIQAKVGADCSSCLIRGRLAQQQTNKASRPPLHGFSGTRVVAATEDVVHRPARARLPDAEQTRAKPMKPEQHIRIFGSGPTNQQGPIV